MASSWVSNPSLVYASGNYAAFTSSLDESGLAAAVIVSDGYAAPSVDQIFAGQDGSGNALPAALVETGVYTDSGVATVLTFSGLGDGTDWDAYIAGSGYSGGYTASGYLVNFSTPDITAPSWSGLYPTLEGVTGSGVNVNFAFGEPASGYALALASGAAFPAAADIVSSGQLLSCPVANAVRQLTYSGLTSETDYAVYAVGRDYSGNLMTSGSLAGYITTSDITAPTITASIGSITTSTAVVSMTLNDAGSGYFVVLPATDSAPSVAQVKAGTDASDAAVSAGLYGSTALAANVAGTVNITNLQYSTQYTIYVAGTDDGANDTAAVISANFRAAVPAPGVVSGAEQRRRRRRREQTARGISMMRGMGMQ